MRAGYRRTIQLALRDRSTMTAAQRCGFAGSRVLSEGKTPSDARQPSPRRSWREIRSRAAHPRFEPSHVEAVAAPRIPRARTSTSAPAVVTDRSRDGARAARPEVAVVSAGTADLPVAEEAAVTLRDRRQSRRTATRMSASPACTGCWHRIDAIRSRPRDHRGRGHGRRSPFSVVAGLVEKPVIAVPTSVGYGASFQRPVGAVDDAQQLRIRRRCRQH